MSLMISVSGVRGIVGQTLTPVLAAEMGAAFGSHLAGGRVVLGRDSRPSGEMVEAALAGGLMSTGSDVVHLGIATTPATAVMVSELRAAGGVVITASHNPGEWNGIKLLTAEGFAPPPEAAGRIFDRYREKSFDFRGPGEVGRASRDESAAECHVARALRVLEGEAIVRRGLKVVLDSVNGAGGAEGRMLLERLGCRVDHLNGEPTGRFAHTPEPTAENLTGLCEAVRRGRADIGFAQDPDADRLAIVDNTGRYIGEEYTLALAAKYVFARRPGPAAANLSTSRMIDDLASAAGGGAKVLRTPVGEANVARAVLERACVIGGEGNGGVIDPRVVAVRDSLVGMGLVLSLLAEDSRPLAAIVDDIPRYVMVKRKYEMDGSAVAGWMDRLRGAVANSPEARLNEADGLRVDWPEGWVHVRPSNTEPIARLIAEAGDEATTAALVRRVEGLR